MHASSWPGPRLKQRFEFGAQGACGSSWASDWSKTVQGLHELAAPPLPLARGQRSQFLAGARKSETRRICTAEALSAREKFWEGVGPGCDRPVAGFFDSGSLRSPSSKNPATGPTLKPTCCQTHYARETALENTYKQREQRATLGRLTQFHRQSFQDCPGLPDRTGTGCWFNQV